MEKYELARQMDAASRIHGQFRLRSGTVSGEYFDKYRFESEPELLAAIADGLAELIPPGIDALAGLELGGVPIATALSLRTGLPVVFVRKQPKSYGTCRLAEGRPATRRSHSGSCRLRNRSPGRRDGSAGRGRSEASSVVH